MRVLNTGRVAPSPDDVERIHHFGALPAKQFEQVAAESLIREGLINQLVWPAAQASSQESASSDELVFSDVEDAHSEASDSEQAANDPFSSTAGHRPSKRRRVSVDESAQSRRFGDAVIDYVPAYLPLFPSASSAAESPEAPRGSRSEEVATGSSTVKAEVAPVEVDPEHLLEEQKRRELAQRKAEEAAAAAAAAEAEAAKKEAAEGEGEGAAAVQKTAEERAAEAEKAFEALQARRVLRDSWLEMVPYDASTLAATYGKAELRDLEHNVAAVLGDASIASIGAPTSSLRAFAADYQALVEDSTSSGSAGIYLTPSAASYQDALVKRRRLAHALADASRYAPNDSLYAAVAARPSVLPFVPGPSWLVSTLPPPTLYEDNIEVANALSAPVLTPLRPQGRPAALIPPSGRWCLRWSIDIRLI